MSAKRETTATLRYKVLAPKAPGHIATVTILVKTPAGKTVVTLRPGDERTGVALKCTFTVTLKKGVYRWYVYATDAAGKHAAHPGGDSLTVR